MYIGAETCSDNTAELSAVVVPLWLLLGILTHQHLHVWLDSKYTIDMVEGRCRLVMHCKLIQNARQIVNMHRSHHGLRFTHVRSHTNNIANEFADRVADLARRGVTINVFPDIDPVLPSIPLDYRCAVPSRVVDADGDARAAFFWNSVEFESVDPKCLKRSVLPSPMRQGLPVQPPMFSRCRRPDPCRLPASVVATSLDAEPPHSSSLRCRCFDRWPSGDSVKRGL